MLVKAMRIPAKSVTPNARYRRNASPATVFPTLDAGKGNAQYQQRTPPDKPSQRSYGEECREPVRRACPHVEVGEVSGEGYSSHRRGQVPHALRG